MVAEAPNDARQQPGAAVRARGTTARDGKSGRMHSLERRSVPGLANAEPDRHSLLIRDELSAYLIEPVSRRRRARARPLCNRRQQIASDPQCTATNSDTQAVAALQEANLCLRLDCGANRALERELRVAQALLNEARNRVEALARRSLSSALRDAIARQAKRPSRSSDRSCGVGKKPRARSTECPAQGVIFVSCPEVTLSIDMLAAGPHRFGSRYREQIRTCVRRYAVSRCGARLTVRPSARSSGYAGQRSKPSTSQRS